MQLNPCECDGRIAAWQDGVLIRLDVRFRDVTI